MIRYTVVWSTPALSQLAQLWIDAGDRDAVNTAAASIDRELAANPESKGEGLHEGLRAFEAQPLYVLYTASEPDRLVRVVRLRLHNTPRLAPEANGASQKAR
jgi:plasmid stabilization system protein ParE